MTITNKTNLPPITHLSDDHLKMVGLVIATWGMFESHLIYLLCQFATKSKRRSQKAWEASLFLTTGMSWTTTLGLIRSLVVGHFPEDKTEFDKLRQRIKDSKDLRDLLAHNFIIEGEGKNSNTIVVLRMKSVNQYQSVIRKFTKQELYDLAAKIRSEQMELGCVDIR